MHASSGIAPEEADGRSSASAISDVAVPAFRVRVRTMAGEVLTVPCPDGALTTVGNVKRVMSTLRPVAWSRKRLCLMLPQSPTSESHELSPTSQHPTPLADDAIVSACGIKGSTNILFDLFVQDLVWSASERKLHALIANGKRDVSIRGLTDQDVAAVAWALSNEVCHQPCSLLRAYRLDQQFIFIVNISAMHITSTGQPILAGIEPPFLRDWQCWLGRSWRGIARGRGRTHAVITDQQWNL